MLTDLFKSEKRLKILYYCLYQEEFTVTLVSKEAGVTKGLVSRYLHKLCKTGLIDRTDRTYMCRDSAKTRAVKILLNLNKINEHVLKRNWITGFGLFGSWATGTNTHESDVDIWIKTKTYPSELEISKLQKKIKDMVEREVNLIILTPQKINDIKEKDKPFYHSLIKDSIVLWGEPIEL